MKTSELLSQIDAELARLQNVRALLAEVTTPSKATRTASNRRRKRKPLSPEARARIAAAQKKRWAKARKATK